LELDLTEKFPARTYHFHAGTSALKEINFEFYLELLPFSIQEKGLGDEVLPLRVTRYA
jgi:hypothetical protein